jgi:predicted ABC-type transport system involved in lysophospholipase L1 biosynthesis ATPase subunit
MMDLIFSLVRQQGATLVVVTHELAIARRASRVLELQDGKIIHHGPDHDSL